MSTPHVLVIGAGAAGLMAAHELIQSGRKVTILEARGRIGGRVHTVSHPNYDQPAEAGAEFIHGDLPITKRLLDEAGIKYQEIAGSFYESSETGLQQMHGNTEEDALVIRCLNSLEHDVTVAQFFQEYLAGEEYAKTREELRSFVEGFDSGDINKASAFTLRDELQSSNEPQYRIDGGYTRLIDYLARQGQEKGVNIILKQQVQSIQWKRGKVSIQTASAAYEGDVALITVPLRVLYEDLHFEPAITQHIDAAKEIGYGHVIKILMQFDKPFWKGNSSYEANDLSFLFSNTPIPTFWTQYPTPSAQLMGWLCGPKAAEMKDLSDEEILIRTLQSLSQAFKIPAVTLQSRLQYSKVYNWVADTYTKGAYAYATVDGSKQRKILRTPVANTIFFAGEGLYIGEHNGTVEAALESALVAVQQILTAQNVQA